MEESFEYKYLKYKFKYFNLKYELEGAGFVLFDKLSGKFNAPKLLAKHTINTFKSFGFDKEVVKKFKHLSLNPLIWNKDFKKDILVRDLSKKGVIKEGIAKQNQIYTTMKKNIKKNKKNIKKMEKALELMSKRKIVKEKEISEVIKKLKLDRKKFMKITHMNVNSTKDIHKYVRFWIIQKKMHDYLMYEILKLK